MVAIMAKSDEVSDTYDVNIANPGSCRTNTSLSHPSSGDKVFFNAGSLLWDYPNLYDADVVKNILWHRFQPCFDGQEIKEGYRLKPYARITKSSRASPKNHIPDSESEYCEFSVVWYDFVCVSIVSSSNFWHCGVSVYNHRSFRR